MLLIPRTAKNVSQKIMKKAKTTKSAINKIRKRLATFFRHVMRMFGIAHHNWQS